MREDSGFRSFTAGEALAAHRLVKLSAGKVVYADAGDQPIGATMAAAADGQLVAVKLLSAAGTLTCIASGAVTAGAAVMPQNDGKVDDAATGKPVGIALNAATADGDPVEVLPLPLETVS